MGKSPIKPETLKTAEMLLEERKVKADRRKQPETPLPKSIERRTGEDRRNEKN